MVGAAANSPHCQRPIGSPTARNTIPAPAITIVTTTGPITARNSPSTRRSASVGRLANSSAGRRRRDLDAMPWLVSSTAAATGRKRLANRTESRSSSGASARNVHQTNSADATNEATTNS